MSKPWVGWLGFAVLAVVVLVSSCQAMGGQALGGQAMGAALPLLAGGAE